MTKRYLPPVLWMAVIFTLSSLPGNAFPEEPFPGFSGLVHLAEYAVLGLLWYRALPKKIFVILAIGIIYAVSDEMHQLFVPYREFSILDMTVDTVGVIIGIITGRQIWH